MSTLVKRLREIVSIEDDDFYDDNTLLFYINKSLVEVVGIYSAMERQSRRSFRCLDELRTSQTISLNGATFVNKGNYYETTLAYLPVLQFLHGVYDDIPLIEITSLRKRLLRIGNLQPSFLECYMYSELDESTGVNSVADFLVVGKAIIDTGESATGSFTIDPTSSISGTFLLRLTISGGDYDVILDPIIIDFSGDVNEVDYAESIRVALQGFTILTDNYTVTRTGNTINLSAKSSGTGYNATLSVIGETQDFVLTQITNLNGGTNGVDSMVFSYDDIEVPVTITNGDSDSIIMSAITTAFNNNVDFLYSYSDGVITSTNTGVNQDKNIYITLKDTITGITYTITGTNDIGNYISLFGGKDGVKRLTVYLHESDTTQTIELDYIKIPYNVIFSDSSFKEVPERLEPVILYNAGIKVLLQENVANPNPMIDELQAVFTKQFQSNSY